MIDFLSMLNVDYKGDKHFIDEFIKEIIMEREKYMPFGKSGY